MGVWSSADLNTLLYLSANYKTISQYPFYGSMCIDFEYQSVISALADLPQGLHFDTVSPSMWIAGVT